jgi:hypothetical protein
MITQELNLASPIEGNPSVWILKLRRLNKTPARDRK